MDLEELKKRLYEKDGEIKDRPKPPDGFEAGKVSESFSSQPAPQWPKEKPKYFVLAAAKKRLTWLIGGVLLIGIIGSAVWFFWARWHVFDKTQIEFSIFGPERLVSGEEATYLVRYKNNSRVVLENAVLTFTFPEQSVLSESQKVSQGGDSLQSVVNLDKLASGEEGQREFKIKTWGDKDSRSRFFAKINYRPAGLNVVFENQAEFESVIIAVPLVLNFDLPKKIVSGQEINFSLRYLNTADVSFENLKVTIEYPAGFVFNNALPYPSEEKNTWLLANLDKRQEGKIIISGSLNGDEGEKKVFRAKIGFAQAETFVAYAQTSDSAQISLSPLVVDQSLSLQSELKADLGQELNYKLKYRNSAGVPIGPVAITLKIESEAVDFNQIRASSGFFDSNTKIITWNVSSLPQLNYLVAGQEGEVVFSLKVKDKLPINNFSDKNFVILTKAKIDSNIVPLSLTGTRLAGENQMEIKVNSRLSFAVRGYYNDRLMPNSGPLPPRAGSKTTYTIYWQLLNVSNDLSDIYAEAYLPSYISWENRVYPPESNISYDKNTGKIGWRIPKLSAATGILLPVKQAVFQIGFTPSVNQIGQVVDLVKDAKISAKDTFTDKEIEVLVVNLKTDLPDDSEVGWSKGRVEQ